MLPVLPVLLVLPAALRSAPNTPCCAVPGPGRAALQYAAWSHNNSKLEETFGFAHKTGKALLILDKGTEKRFGMGSRVGQDFLVHVTPAKGDSSTAKPKRGQPAFFLFCKHKRPIMKQQDPYASFGAVSKLLSEQWAQMNEDARRYAARPPRRGATRGTCRHTCCVAPHPRTAVWTPRPVRVPGAACGTWRSTRVHGTVEKWRRVCVGAAGFCFLWGAQEVLRGGRRVFHGGRPMGAAAARNLCTKP